MARTQSTCVIAVQTALGPDQMMLRKLRGHEGLSELFVYDLEMDSENHRIDYADILGTNLTARLVLPSGETRYWNGFVSRFRQAGVSRDGLAIYRAEVVPWLWFLTRTADCRIFQKKTVPDIVEAIFADFSFGDYRLELTETYPELEYCVQYRETAFNFISRLLEESGIFYYFAHSNGRHEMVMADSRSRLGPYPGYEEVPFRGPGASVAPGEAIAAWNGEYSIVSGAYVHTDYNFKTPAANLRTCNARERAHAQSGYEVYDYPGLFEDCDAGTRLSRTRMEELQWQHEVYQGVANARGIAPGYILKVRGHAQTPSTREFLVVSADYRVWPGVTAADHVQDEEFVCEFRSINAEEPFRPPRHTPKPVIEGPQTAVVVGPAGEEIYPDEYGRVIVQFHWDREGQGNENSSCWIRVAQVWAGRNWGALFLPRIGQEVIVEFLEGNPDRPIITGRVYHAQSMPPYALPDEKTKSTLKSLSSKGGGGFNEFRFEDKKGSEQVFLHAEKDEDVRVKNDSREWIGHDRHLIVKNTQMEKVEQDKHLTVQGDRIAIVGANDDLTVKGDRIQEVKGSDNLAVKGDLLAEVSGDMSLKVATNRKEEVSNDQSLTVGMNQQEKVGMKHALDAGQEIHLKSGMTVVIEAGMQLSLKVGGNFIDIGPAGISIQGTLVNINSGGAAGAGGGSSPKSPDPPATPDEPKDPEAADTAQPGSPNEYCPAALVLRQAALDGTPFCERCQAAAKRREMA